MVVTSLQLKRASQPTSLEEWLLNPPPGSRWVNGQFVERTGKTLKHSRIQCKLSLEWRNYQDAQRLGGEVYINAPCQINQQGRSPDVAYLTPELLSQFGEPNVLPQSFPLSAEIVSPTDLAEEVIAKAQEYLQSGGLEVWLLFPENQWIIVVTQTQRQIFIAGQTVSTQVVLPGFQIAVEKLLN